MNLKNFCPLLLSALLIFVFTINIKAQKSADDLEPAHLAVLQAWIKTQTGWRLAIEKDYNQQRLGDFKTAENAMPFYVVNDFNRDEKKDFAVVLTKDGKFAVAVFNAPFASKKTAFFSTELETDDILYFNKSTKRLLVGPYESDAGFQLIPSGKTYKAQGQM